MYEFRYWNAQTDCTSFSNISIASKDYNCSVSQKKKNISPLSDNSDLYIIIIIILSHILSATSKYVYTSAAVCLLKNVLNSTFPPKKNLSNFGTVL